MTPKSSLWIESRPLLLASQSPVRAAMLKAVGDPVEAVGAEADERAVEDAARRNGAGTPQVALALARAKALAASKKHPGRVVLGADQTLSLGEHALHKPRDLAEALAQLQRMAADAPCSCCRSAGARRQVARRRSHEATITLRPLSAGMIQRCRTWLLR